MQPTILEILIYTVAVLYICNILQLKIKRLHDFNCSGWFVLLIFIPIIGWIWGLLIFVIPGSKGDNRFGAMPEDSSVLEFLIAVFWIPALLLIIFCVLYLSTR